MTGIKQRVTAVLMAVLLAFSFAAIAPTSQQAYAADGDGSITVTSTDAEFNNQTVAGYQMFDVSDGSYVLNSTWEGFFQNQLSSTATGTSLSEAAYNYVFGLESNSTTIADFAQAAANWASTNSFTATATATAAETTTAGTYAATLSNLQYGYYIVVPQDGSPAALVNVTGDNETPEVTLKTDYPTVEKTVNQVGAQIGDTVTFTITSAVPANTTSYDQDTYTFTINDTLSAGLTYNNDATVKIGSAEATTIANATVTTEAGVTSVTLPLGSAVYGQTAGDVITVTYTATINDDALVTTANTTAYTNTASITYSNNPDSNSTGTTTPDQTTTYNYSFTINKVNGAGEALANATFQLSTDSAGTNPVSLVYVSDGVYKVADPSDNTLTTVTTVTTTSTGTIAIYGLGDGTYYLQETAAPTGYNVLGSTVTVTITPDADTPATYALGATGSDKVSVTGSVITVTNTTGIELPTTGGMGTIIFTVVGVLLIAGGAVWMVRRKRNQA